MLPCLLQGSGEGGSAESGDVSAARGALYGECRAQLERYYFLVCFNAYLHEQVRDGQSFQSIIQAIICCGLVNQSIIQEFILINTQSVNHYLIILLFFNNQRFNHFNCLKSSNHSLCYLLF